ncbi:polysaccharide deacetylase family protein [Lottiidibacillus patelloidae]|uniref:polysaccharide deacetylase family protein n=1 Tax=Lottiidibacillus patelloidae TaxID=2670334 RepID=UPI001E5E7ED7|nr:polysaccharide deacetylase family protein [Lottiidibacillus patelloidae]
MEQYYNNLIGVQQAVPKMLALFNKYEIHSTWATVGFLFFKNGEQLLKQIPLVLPNYQDKNLSPYEDLKVLAKQGKHGDTTLFAYPLIQLIKNTPNQEIATHTFSHYYCLEPGQTKASFKEDLKAAFKVANDEGIKMSSLIFPRNQVNSSYLEICKDFGITCYRGNENSLIYRASNKLENKLWKRGVRFLDAYFNLTGHHTYKVSDISREPLINLPASRFLRPYSKSLSFLEKLRLYRIKKNITYAAKHKEIYHLWWHPHNFGTNLEYNIKFLEEVLLHYKKMQKKYGMESINMGELANYLK